MGTQIGITRWMLVPDLCDRLSYEEKPRIGLEALVDLRRLVDSQCVDGWRLCRICNQEVKMQKQQEGSHRVAAEAAVRRRGDFGPNYRSRPGELPRTLASTDEMRPRGRRQEFQ